ncbi:relaxase domain-containing protein [Ruficoccus amylovorans]|uniref:Relaxase domain-containing protein n=1 Tax=Ruficoccus amylovorans TaxID=1804625 RepID=A0A842HD82_9BACT|nr:MobF family relaxase [Ruficoccus amylovorans]MBC2593504.1 relaxase domain-containing protein [Ruficoccus amylovorans]
MLTPKAQFNLKNAKQYFREHLKVGDYYAHDNAIQGEWFGQGAERLGLRGAVGEREFMELCEGNNPATGMRLTLRKNTTRQVGDREVANRRIFYDFTISPPKSVSLMALFQDKRLVKIHDEAVQKAMRELETFAMTRVRKLGRSDDRETGNVIGAAFRHETSRALDPHLHTHCVIMNATFDPVEKRWKALQNYEMLKAQKFVENYYYHELAKGLHRYGYPIKNNARDFELEGVSPELIERFSKRHLEIDEGVREYLSNGERPGNIKELRAQIAHQNRARKIHAFPPEKLHDLWREQMSDEERVSIAVGSLTQGDLKDEADVPALVDWSEAHVFERKSVTEDYRLKAAALARGRGKTFTLEELNAEMERRDYLRDAYHPHWVSTSQLREREQEIVNMAVLGVNSHPPFCENYQPSPALSDEQKDAVRSLLASEHFVTLFRGGAGTGKTFTLQEVDRGLRQAGFQTLALAPQRQQVLGLQRDGFEAQTLGRDELERAFIAEYRNVVKAASEGKAFESFERLDAMDCIEEIDGDERREALAFDYVEARKAGEKTLVVSQTWDEIHAVNAAVRQRLKEEGLLGKDVPVTLYESRDLDSAQKQDARYYHPGDHVYFIRKYGRFAKGDLVPVESVDENSLSLCKDGKLSAVSLKQAEHFVVVRPHSIELARGDRLQLKFNGRSEDGKPLDNGELVTVARIFKNGHLSVVDDRGVRKTLAANQHLANLGYAVTSYASQGKTVDTVLFSDSQNRAATDRRQWYVTISRARRKIKIYTASKESLRENLLRSGDEPLAMDLECASPRKDVAVKLPPRRSRIDDDYPLPSGPSQSHGISL